MQSRNVLSLAKTKKSTSVLCFSVTFYLLITKQLYLYSGDIPGYQGKPSVLLNYEVVYKGRFEIDQEIAHEPCMLTECAYF